MPPMTRGHYSGKIEGPIPRSAMESNTPMPYSVERYLAPNDPYARDPNVNKSAWPATSASEWPREQGPSRSPRLRRPERAPQTHAVEVLSTFNGRIPFAESESPDIMYSSNARGGVYASVRTVHATPKVAPPHPYEISPPDAPKHAWGPGSKVPVFTKGTCASIEDIQHEAFWVRYQEQERQRSERNEKKEAKEYEAFWRKYHAEEAHRDWLRRKAKQAGGSSRADGQNSVQAASQDEEGTKARKLRAEKAFEEWLSAKKNEPKRKKESMAKKKDVAPANFFAACETEEERKAKADKAFEEWKEEKKAQLEKQERDRKAKEEADRQAAEELEKEKQAKRDAAKEEVRKWEEKKRKARLEELRAKRQEEKRLVEERELEIKRKWGKRSVVLACSANVLEMRRVDAVEGGERTDVNSLSPRHPVRETGKGSPGVLDRRREKSRAKVQAKITLEERERENQRLKEQLEQLQRAVRIGDAPKGGVAAREAPRPVTARARSKPLRRAVSSSRTTHAKPAAREIARSISPLGGRSGPCFDPYSSSPERKPEPAIKFKARGMPNFDQLHMKNQQHLSKVKTRIVNQSKFKFSRVMAKVFDGAHEEYDDDEFEDDLDVSATPKRTKPHTSQNSSDSKEIGIPLALQPHDPLKDHDFANDDHKVVDSMKKTASAMSTQLTPSPDEPEPSSITNAARLLVAAKPLVSAAPNIKKADAGGSDEFRSDENELRPRTHSYKPQNAAKPSFLKSSATDKIENKEDGTSCNSEAPENEEGKLDKDQKDKKEEKEAAVDESQQSIVVIADETGNEDATTLEASQAQPEETGHGQKGLGSEGHHNDDDDGGRGSALEGSTLEELSEEESIGSPAPLVRQLSSSTSHAYKAKGKTSGQTIAPISASMQTTSKNTEDSLALSASEGGSTSKQERDNKSGDITTESGDHSVISAAPETPARVIDVQKEIARTSEATFSPTSPLIKPRKTTVEPPRSRGLSPQLETE